MRVQIFKKRRLTMSNEKQEYQIDESMIDSYAQDDAADADAEKLREMNKKLPTWSLEPPKAFLK